MLFFFVLDDLSSTKCSFLVNNKLLDYTQGLPESLIDIIKIQLNSRISLNIKVYFILISILLEDNFRFAHEGTSRSLAITERISFSMFFTKLFQKIFLLPTLIFPAKMLHYFFYFNIKFHNQCYNPIIKFVLVFLPNPEVHIFANFSFVAFVHLKKMKLFPILYNVQQKSFS